MMLPIVLVGDEIVCYMTWVIPYLLLSPFPVFLYAQNHESVTVGSSWHLAYFRASGDEVKGLYLCACDDLLAEAVHVYVSVDVSWFLASLSMARGVHSARLIPGCSCVWAVLQVAMEPPLYQACMSSFRLDVHLMRTTAFTPSADTQLFLDMYLFKFVDCIFFHPSTQALRLCNCIQQYPPCCICYYILIEYPHFAGYGLCYCAPVWHYGMPGSAPSGLGIHRFLIMCLVFVCCGIAITMSLLCILVMCEDKLISDPTFSTKPNSIWIFLASGPEKDIMPSTCDIMLLT